MQHWAAGLGIWLAAGAALADCPPPLTQGEGIVLTREEPFFESLFRATDTGLSEARILSRGGAAEAVSTTYLHPLAPQDRLANGETLTIRYGADVSGLDTLRPGESWRSDVVVARDGMIIASGAVTKTLARTDTVTLDGCPLEVWMVEDRLDLGLGDDSWFLLVYAPSLGVVVGSMKMTGAGATLDGVIYDRIRAAP
jgi:hypothetical protein